MTYYVIIPLSLFFFSLKLELFEFLDFFNSFFFVFRSFVGLFIYQKIHFGAFIIKANKIKIKTTTNNEITKENINE